MVGERSPRRRMRGNPPGAAAWRVGPPQGSRVRCRWLNRCTLLPHEVEKAHVVRTGGGYLDRSCELLSSVDPPDAAVPRLRTALPSTSQRRGRGFASPDTLSLCARYSREGAERRGAPPNWRLDDGA